MVRFGITFRRFLTDKMSLSTHAGYARCIKHALHHIRKNKPSDYIINNDQGKGVQRLDCGSRGSIVNVASISSWIAQAEFIPCEYDIADRQPPIPPSTTAIDLWYQSPASCSPLAVLYRNDLPLVEEELLTD